jgi:hypothetical protein
VNVLSQDAAKVLAEVVVQGYRTSIKEISISAVATILLQISRIDQMPMP